MTDILAFFAAVFTALSLISPASVPGEHGPGWPVPTLRAAGADLFHH